MNKSELLLYVCLVMALSPRLAFAEDLTGSTSCADYISMQAQDTGPNADPVVARAHVNSLMREYAKYVLRDQSGQLIPTVVNFIISYSTAYCRAHPNADVAQAGQAVGVAEQQALARVNAQQ